ncbi:hypothetical protein ILFOPFJJ_01899 [Ensifer psoraleae]|uniref:glycosyltransferase n=1 Tax=Sinorhizobium psoraleae TaxID=520838 RepID=UPI0024AACDF6|nr:hypothetical protein [Sinorhizobium psoraleae]
MLEAAAGRSIIISDVGGAKTVVDNGENGLIIPNSDDVSQLAKTMIAAATGNATLRSSKRPRRATSASPSTSCLTGWRNFIDV